jgi:hypothetical protein
VAVVACCGLSSSEAAEEVAGYVHAGTAEADDVDTPVTGDIGDEAGVVVDPPGTCVVVYSNPRHTNWACLN